MDLNKKHSSDSFEDALFSYFNVDFLVLFLKFLGQKKRFNRDHNKRKSNKEQY